MPGSLLVAIGLLLTVSPPMINDIFDFKFSDYFRGLLVGIGLGLEVIGIILQRKTAKMRCRDKMSSIEDAI